MTQKQGDVILLTLVEKYVIAQYAISRHVTLFEKDAQARDATTFWERKPSSANVHIKGIKFLLLKKVS